MANKYIPNIYIFSRQDYNVYEKQDSYLGV